MSTINTDQIDNINEQLDGIIDYINSYTNTFQDMVNIAGNNAQEAIDNAAADLSNEINEQLSVIRTKIINIFSAQYQIAMEKIAPIQAILEALPISADLGAIVSVLTSVVDIITAPYQPIIEFTTQIIPKVLELSSKLQTIASYRPTIDIPGIEPPEFDISIEPITAEDITG